jgi:hypothetical protein
LLFNLPRRGANTSRHIKSRVPSSGISSRLTSLFKWDTFQSLINMHECKSIAAPIG